MQNAAKNDKLAVFCRQPSHSVLAGGRPKMETTIAGGCIIARRMVRNREPSRRKDIQPRSVFVGNAGGAECIQVMVRPVELSFRAGDDGLRGLGHSTLLRVQLRSHNLRAAILRHQSALEL